MSNQNPLLSPEVFSGNSGLIDVMFEHWIDQRIAEGHPIDKTNVDQMTWLKFVFYGACCEMYNACITVIRGDASLRGFSIFSEGARLNIENFFSDLSKPTVN